MNDANVTNQISSWGGCHMTKLEINCYSINIKNHLLFYIVIEFKIIIFYSYFCITKKIPSCFMVGPGIFSYLLMN